MNKINIMHSLTILEKGTAELRTSIASMKEPLNINDFNDINKIVISLSYTFQSISKLLDGKIFESLELANESKKWMELDE
jgi:hypothetical protein